MSIKAVKIAINAQWQAMINAGLIPAMEFSIIGNDFVVVDIELPTTQYRDIQTGELIRETLEKDYICFSFDQMGKGVWFDGDIKGKDNFYRISLDSCFDNLDYYLQRIGENIMEGFIIPNGLGCEEVE